MPECSQIVSQESSIKGSTLSLQTAWTGFNPYLHSSGSSSAGSALVENSKLQAFIHKRGIVCNFIIWFGDHMLPWYSCHLLGRVLWLFNNRLHTSVYILCYWATFNSVMRITSVCLAQFAEQVDKLWSYCEKRNYYKTGYAVIGPIDQRGHLNTGNCQSVLRFHARQPTMNRTPFVNSHQGKCEFPIPIA